MSVIPATAGFGATAFRAAGMNRATSDWQYWQRDPRTDWVFDAKRLAARAWDLYRNEPVLAALVQAKIIGTHGSVGLRFRSLFGDTNENETTEAESSQRRALETVIARGTGGHQIDASGLMTRHEFEEAVDLMATVSGECFAVRMWIPGRPGCAYATCWRLIRPERVCNPPDRPDSETLYQGIELNPETGAPLGIWVSPAYEYGVMPSYDPRDWNFVPWYGEDGARSVIHRLGLRIPGSYRGVSMLAQNMFQAKQTSELMNSYLIAKRIQASMPVFIKCDDPAEAAKNDRNGVVYGPNTVIEPGKIYYIGRDSEITFPPLQFQGADMREFLDTCYRNQFAAWGLPIDIVLAQLGETNMAASRSAWLQYYRACERWQDDHIEQVTGPINESLAREAAARGEISLSADWHENMRGRYVRPPRAMPDPLKEAQAVQLWKTLGRDLTGLYAESGVDFQESIRQRAEDNALMEAQGVQDESLQMAQAALDSKAQQQPSAEEETPAPAEKGAAAGSPQALNFDIRVENKPGEAPAQVKRSIAFTYAADGSIASAKEV